MGDEVLTGLAALVGVVLAGEHERAHDRVAVDGLRDLLGVLLDDREQVAEQLALERGQVGGRLQRRRAVGLRAVDRAVGGDADAGAIAALGGRLAAGQAAALSVLLARYRSPSSSRCW
jgi:hypothetical protein